MTAPSRAMRGARSRTVKMPAASRTAPKPRRVQATVRIREKSGCIQASSERGDEADSMCTGVTKPGAERTLRVKVALDQRMSRRLARVGAWMVVGSPEVMVALRNRVPFRLVNVTCAGCAGEAPTKEMV